MKPYLWVCSQRGAAQAAETGLFAPDPLNLIRIMPAEGLRADIPEGHVQSSIQRRMEVL